MTAFSTRAVHAGREDLTDLGIHAVPLDLSTTYPARDAQIEAGRLDTFATGEQPHGLPVYGRVGNPTVQRFEAALADLEGCEAAVAFATGMAAMSACLLAATMAGKRHVVGVRPMYGTSDRMLESGLLGGSVSWAATVDEVAEAITADTGLVMVETFSNPMLTEIDLKLLAVACGDVPLLVDNTFATPVLRRPAEQGARLVMHSATKFLGGHGDVMGGVVACDEETARSLRQVRMATGGILHPLAGYLLLRGLSTLPIRIKAASATAAELAKRLAEHPRVKKVHYPGDGALVSFEVSNATDVVSAVRLITPAVSLGTVDTLIQHPASLTHRSMSEHDRIGAGISDDVLRLSVGLEDVDDLWADLDQGLRPTPPSSR
ncbi:MAG: PLP-dependent transferase [Kibdelosporangium sp.]